MGFIEEYKRLERLYHDMTGEEKPVTAYIDKMESIGDGAKYVSGWDEDLKMLKHCRWARNRIVHDPGCTEENTCDPGDAENIRRFYSRLFSEQDPLTLYRSARRNTNRNRGVGVRQNSTEVGGDDSRSPAGKAPGDSAGMRQNRTLQSGDDSRSPAGEAPKGNTGCIIAAVIFAVIAVAGVITAAILL